MIWKRIEARDRRNVLALALLLCAFYAPALYAWGVGGWAFNDDAPGLFAPWRAYAAHEIGLGRWPLWNPWIFGGLPFALNGQAALGYPPNILFWLLPFKSALVLDALLHSVWLGAGAYFLGRTLGLSRTASWLLGLCVGASGAVSAHVYGGHLTWHAARAWIPWMLWALARGLQTRRVRYAYVLALFFFLQLASGYPPLALAGAGLCALAFLVRLVRVRLAPREGEGRSIGWVWRWALIAGGLSGALAMPLALGLREVSGLSVHGSGLPWEEASELSGTWKSLARWVAPGVFNMARPMQWSVRYGAHEEASAIGLLPLVLALGAPLWMSGLALRRERFYAASLWLGMLSCVVLALGANTPLYRGLFDHVGLFRVLRFPVRWLEVWALLASLSAAFAFDSWRRAQADSLRPRLLAMGAASLAMAVGALGAAAWLGSRGETEFWRPLALSLDAFRPEAHRLRAITSLRTVAVGECVWAALLGVAAALIFLGARRSRRPQRWQRLALALVALDLGALFVRSERVWIEGSRPNGARISEALASRQKRGERWITRVDWRGMNSAMEARVELFNGYDAMNTSAFWSLAQAVEGREFWVDMYQPTRIGPALRLAGVTHALLQDNLTIPLPKDARLEASQGPWKLWRLFAGRDVWPRLFLTRRVQSAPASANEAGFVNALAQLARSPSPARGEDWPLLLSRSASSTWGAPASTSARPSGASGRVLRWKSRPNVLECEVEAAAACWLGISQAWSPSWKAWVDGRPADLERANGPFCALRVPRGRSIVRLAYEPQSWRLGSFVGLCALGVLAAGAALFLHGPRIGTETARIKTDFVDG